MESIELRARPGSIVMYYSHGSSNGKYKPEPAPAIVVRVNGDQNVRLVIFRDEGFHFKDVPFSDSPKPGHWSWEC